MRPPPDRARSRPPRQRGQVLPLGAMMFMVLFAFAGLAIDAGHIYLVYRNTQNAADAAALAAGKNLAIALQGNQLAVGSSTTNASLQGAHDLAAANGFSTVLSAACDANTANTPQAGLTQFSAHWYDTGGPCGTTAFNTHIAIYQPPPSLTYNCQGYPYNCLQVVVTQQVQNYLMGVLGQPTSTVRASSTVYAGPPKGAFNLPKPLALYLYQPQSGCTPLGQQCFDETKAPSRSGMNCGGGAPNCPTIWVRPGSAPVIKGIDGQTLNPRADTTAAQSNGDAILQDATTICDPNGGATCSAGVTTGALGLAMSTGSTLFCSGFDPLSSSKTSPPCTVSAVQAPLATLYTNETVFAAQSWTPVVDTSGPTCGGLVLNGAQVTPSLAAGHAPACEPPASSPYTILPGQYTSIVINHGQYDFEAGVYLISGQAPNDTAPAGVQANGIDHSGEGPADWDLCGGVACAEPVGIYIGHGTKPFVAAGGGTPLGTCEDGSPQIGQTGGGDVTRITGNGVTFVFQGPTSGGFVSTHAVDYISMISSAPGQLPATNGVPLLFWLDNNNWIHLDAAGTNPNSHFKGIIYQSQTVKAGGVEVNPGLAGPNAAAIGQVWAYSFTTFGSPGIALDFSKGFGAASYSPVGTSGDEEQEILTSATLVDPGKPGFESLVMVYQDEWKLDAYTAYVRINNGPPVFFSEGIWNPPLGAGQAPPPPDNNPGDRFPALPTAAQNLAAGNKYTINAASTKPDWTMTYADLSTFQIVGDWMWGHEESMAGTTEGSNVATLTYTFKIPPGSQVTVTMFMADGDSCGDFAIATVTFTNVTPPNPGTQVVGTVRLEQ